MVTNKKTKITISVKQKQYFAYKLKQENNNL